MEIHVKSCGQGEGFRRVALGEIRGWEDSRQMRLIREACLAKTNSNANTKQTGTERNFLRPAAGGGPFHNVANITSTKSAAVVKHNFGGNEQRFFGQIESFAGRIGIVQMGIAGDEALVER